MLSFVLTSYWLCHVMVQKHAWQSLWLVQPEFLDSCNDVPAFISVSREWLSYGKDGNVSPAIKNRTYGQEVEQEKKCRETARSSMQGQVSCMLCQVVDRVDRLEPTTVIRVWIFN